MADGDPDSGQEKDGIAGRSVGICANCHRGRVNRFPREKAEFYGKGTRRDHICHALCLLLLYVYVRSRFIRSGLSA